MTSKLSLISSGILLLIALYSTFLFFRTILSHLHPEFMLAKALPLAIFSGFTWVALSVMLRKIES